MDMLNLSPNERLDLADLTYATFDSQLGLHRQITGQVLTNPNADQPAFILSGFGVTNPAGSQVTVTRGVALLPYRKGAQVLFGMVACEGPATQTLDLSSRATGTYTVYVSFSYQPGALDTRTLWTPENGGAEYSQSVPTRMVAGWQMVAESVSPGLEWLPIATVTLPSMAIVDMRPLFFEGRADQAFIPQWGSDADRDTDRAAAPIGDLQTFVQAMQQCLIDIKGPGIADWYTSFVAGQTIGFEGMTVSGRTAWLDDNFFAQGDSSSPGFTFSSDGARTGYSRTKSNFFLQGGAESSATSLTFADQAAGTPLYTLQANSTALSLIDNGANSAAASYTPASKTLDLSGGNSTTVLLPPSSQVKYATPQAVTQYLPIMSGIAALGAIYYSAAYPLAGASYTYTPSGGGTYSALTGVISLTMASGTPSGAVGISYVLPLTLPGACTLTQIQMNYISGLGQGGNILLMKKPNPSTTTQTGTAATVVAKAIVTQTSSTALGAEGYATYPLKLALSEPVTADSQASYFILLNMINPNAAAPAPILSNFAITIDYISLTYTVPGPT